jgi:uncharacterized protein (TIGR03382 family)
VRSTILIVLIATTAVHADPTGPHPRILLDSQLRDAWQQQAKAAHGPVKGAMALCEDARITKEHDHAVYQGSEWAKVLQACLVSWAATDSKDDAATAIRYFSALLDDLDAVGDHRGGDEAARRDDGYAIRNLGPYTALAYDWLYDRMSPELRAHARARWKAWLDWWRVKGYRAHGAGTNYHAGYALAATFIAIAQHGDDNSLWPEVSGTIWGKEIAGALADDGVLAGGDWPEGWQYGPLSVAEYAVGARAMRGVGVDIPGVARWESAMLKRHVYALSPAGGWFPGGDTESETATIAPNVLALDAIALGDTSPDDKRWARGELSRLQLVDRDWLLYDALAGVGDKPVVPPREKWPAWYLAAGSGTLFARTRWDDSAIWFVTTCHASIDVDHRHPDAGNFVVSRGKDDVIVDPSPYGTQSTLTSNAPTVASAHLPKEYIPSQAFWSERTSFDFTSVRASGVIAARCDYSDQYKFQQRKSDVPDALRDLVVVPSADGRDAVVVVVDRADTNSDDRKMFLRFRTPGHLALAGETGTASVGATKLAITSIARSSGKAAIGVTALKDCFKEGTVRGTCDAARIPVTDYRVEIAGPKPSAVHAIALTGDGKAETKEISGDGWEGARVSGVRDAVVIWRKPGSPAVTAYKAPAGTHVVLDSAEQNGMATATGKPDGDGCAIAITAGGSMSARPLVLAVDAKCNVTSDPEAAGGSTPFSTPKHASTPHSPRAGCCGAQTTPGSPIAMSAVVLAIVLRRRRRRVAT